MKKIILFFAIGLITLPGMVQAEDLATDPAKLVSESFRRDFPHASLISWQMKDAGVHIARFIINGNTRLAYYRDNGEFIGQVWTVDFRDVPARVQKAILKGNKGLDMQSIYLFYPSEGHPNYFVISESNGKSLTREITADGQSAIIRKKRISI